MYNRFLGPGNTVPEEGAFNRTSRKPSTLIPTCSLSKITKKREMQSIVLKYFYNMIE
jgi:hypothetical protein